MHESRRVVAACTSCMRHILRAILIVTLLGGLACSATPDSSYTWMKTFGEQGYYHTYSVQQTSDGGYVMAGVDRSDSLLAERLLVIKTDGDGQEQWITKLGIASYGRDVQETAGNGYIAVGWALPDDTEGINVLLVKMDSEGNEKWSKTFGGPKNDLGYGVRQSDDGGYIVVGTTRSYAAGRADAWLIKTDAHGNEEWSKTFGGEYAGYAVEQMADGGYVVAGRGKSEFETAKGWLMRTCPNGEAIWSKAFDGLYTANCVQETTDGGFIVSGKDSVLKADSNGEELWRKDFGSPADWAYCIQQTLDGGYIVAGQANAFVQMPKGHLFQCGKAPSKNALIVKLDARRARGIGTRSLAVQATDQHYP